MDFGILIDQESKQDVSVDLWPASHERVCGRSFQIPHSPSFLRRTGLSAPASGAKRTRIGYLEFYSTCQNNVPFG